jgi:hypothetical protein
MPRRYSWRKGIPLRRCEHFYTREDAAVCDPPVNAAAARVPGVFQKIEFLDLPVSCACNRRELKPELHVSLPHPFGTGNPHERRQSHGPHHRGQREFPDRRCRSKRSGTSIEEGTGMGVRATYPATVHSLKSPVGRTRSPRYKIFLYRGWYRGICMLCMH